MSGQYFENPTPVTGETFCEVARPHRSRRRTGSTRRTQPRRAGARHRPPGAQHWCSTASPIGSRPTSNRSRWPGVGQRQPIRETLNADIPLAVDHPLCRRHPRAGRGTQRDRRRHRRLPLPRTPRGRRPDHPVELPLLMAAGLRPALAAGNASSSNLPNRPRCRSCT